MGLGESMKVVANIKAQTVPAILIVVGAAMAMSGAGLDNPWLAQALLVALKEGFPPSFSSIHSALGIR